MTSSASHPGAHPDGPDGQGEDIGAAVVYLARRKPATSPARRFTSTAAWRCREALRVVRPAQDPALLRRLLRAKDRMDAASHEAWPVTRLAQVSGVSEAHFARSFKEAFGVPPHRYLLTRRIERATALLRDTDCPSPTSPSRPAGTAWAPLAASSATSPARARASSARASRRRAHDLDRVPHCFVSAAHRPDLKIAVSEKRRRGRRTI